MSLEFLLGGFILVSVGFFYCAFALTTKERAIYILPGAAGIIGGLLFASLALLK
jgi:hypothetical protein